MTRAEDALHLARRGWHVFRVNVFVNGRCTCRAGRNCESPGKHPLAFGWEAEATCDETTIRRWWPDGCLLNIGIACGPSRLGVLDIDPAKGGWESLRELEERAGPLPETVTALTGGGGEHRIFDASRLSVATKTDVMPGLDIRGIHGLIVAVGSVHVSGRRYEWEVSHHPDDMAPATIPLRIWELAQQRTERAEPLPEKIEKGGRNAWLFSAAGTMRRRGMGREEILAAITVSNRLRCAPPLDTAEVEKLVESVCRYAPEEVSKVRTMRWQPPVPPVTGSLRERARTISEEEVRAWQR